MEESIKFVFEEIKQRFNEQIRSIESIDTKAGILLGFAGLILTSVLGYNLLKDMSLVFSIICAAPLIASIILLGLACTVSGYQYSPDPEQLSEKHLLTPPDDIMKQLISNWRTDYRENEGKIKRKSWFINISVYSLLIGLLLLTTCIVIKGGK